MSYELSRVELIFCTLLIIYVGTRVRRWGGITAPTVSRWLCLLATEVCWVRSNVTYLLSCLHVSICLSVIICSTSPVAICELIFCVERALSKRITKHQGAPKTVVELRRASCQMLSSNIMLFLVIAISTWHCEIVTWQRWKYFGDVWPNRNQALLTKLFHVVSLS